MYGEPGTLLGKTSLHDRTTCGQAMSPSFDSHQDSVLWVEGPATGLQDEDSLASYNDVTLAKEGEIQSQDHF